MDNIIAALITAAATIAASLIASARTRARDEVRRKQSPLREQKQQSFVSADGKHCPNCGEDIGIMSIVKALTPNRINCPHCGSRLAYDGGAAMTLIAVLAGALLAIYLLSKGTTFPGFLVGLVFFGSLFEAFFVAYVRTEGQLRLIHRGRR